MKGIIKLSARYVISSKGSTLLVSVISVLGIALSVMALLLTMAVFAGFQHALKEKILSSSPHVIISVIGEKDLTSKEMEIRKVNEVKYFYPVVVYQGMVSNGESFQSVSVKGLKKEDMKMRKNYLLDGKETGNLIGIGMASVLGISVGKEILLVSPIGIQTPLGFLPKSTRIKVDGIFRVGTFDQDYLTLIMPMENALEFFGDRWQLYGFEIFLKDPYKAQEVKVELERRLGDGVYVRSWIDLNAPLFNALELEKVGLFFVLLLMVVIAGFNITSLLFMKIKEKMKDIAVLRTFGMSTKETALLFVLQGIMLGLVGLVLGLLLSLVGGYLINEYKLIRVPSDVYLMDHVPAHFTIKDVVYTSFSAIALSFLASLLPAYRASKSQVVEILRNE